MYMLVTSLTRAHIPPLLSRGTVVKGRHRASPHYSTRYPWLCGAAQMPERDNGDSEVLEVAWSRPMEVSK